MFLLFGFFLLHTTIISGEECPQEKKVGDICYTRVAMTDTHQYGCMENCTYKKTNSSDTGLYCFKTGSLQVTKCGETLPPFEVTCGDGQREDSCNECPATVAGCTSFDCVFLDGKCKPKETLPIFGVTCGDGQREEFCNECPATEEGCTSIDCIFNFFDGKCEPREILPPFGVTCGDGQREGFCRECPATEEGCTSIDCVFIFNLLDGKCESRTPETFSASGCLSCITKDCLTCLPVCSDVIGLECVRCVVANCFNNCGSVCIPPNPQ